MDLSKLKRMIVGDKVNIKNRFDIKAKSSGLGTMSIVYHVHDQELGMGVCLKILDKVKTAEFERRFHGLKKPPEGEICLGLRHPNIVMTYEHGITIKDEPFIVMEWIEGNSMTLLIETNNVLLRGNRANFVAQLADALEYCHQQKVLHRDICPRNVIVATGGVVKLIDFGLSLPYTPNFCQPGNRTGTTEYLAPEIIRRLSTDHRVDIFALGVTAYEIYTGKLPWGKLENVQKLLAHMCHAPINPRVHRPDFDDATVEFLLKAVETHPPKRFQTAAAFRDAAQRLPKEW